MKIIVALSGGLDSVVSLYALSKKQAFLRALFLDFGKKCSAHEMASAKRAAFRLNIPLEIVNVAGLGALQLGYVSPLGHESDELDVRGWGFQDDDHVSGFTILVSIAQYYAQLTQFDAVAFGVIEEQRVSRPLLLEIGTGLAQAQSALNPQAPSVSFEFPLRGLTKPSVVKLGADLQVPLKDTWSCLRDNIYHCGTCSQCLARKEAFAAAEVVDETNYLS